MSGPDDEEHHVKHAIDRLYDAHDAVKEAQADLRSANLLTESLEREYDTTEQRIEDLIKELQERE